MLTLRESVEGIPPITRAVYILCWYVSSEQTAIEVKLVIISVCTIPHISELWDTSHRQYQRWWVVTIIAKPSVSAMGYSDLGNVTIAWIITSMISMLCGLFIVHQWYRNYYHTPRGYGSLGITTIFLLCNVFSRTTIATVSVITDLERIDKLVYPMHKWVHRTWGIIPKNEFVSSTCCTSPPAVKLRLEWIPQWVIPQSLVALMVSI